MNNKKLKIPNKVKRRNKELLLKAKLKTTIRNSNRRKEFLMAVKNIL
jgi:hypothetical protein